MARGILIGVAGGTGSGKTLVVQHMIQQLGSDRVVVLQQDSYYKKLNHLSFAERAAQNFDHPNSIDSELLIQHVEELLNGWTVDIPVYDFTTHTRREETRRAGPHDIIVLEGILILDNPRLRELMDIKVYVDTDPDIRFIRRLKRDTQERGRTVQSIIDQYEKTVRPMHLQFVEPTKRYADIIVPEGGYNWVAIDLLKTKIGVLLQEQLEKRNEMG